VLPQAVVQASPGDGLRVGYDAANHPIDPRRDSKWMHNSIVKPEHPTARRIFQQTLDALRDDPQMRSDRSALTNTCCSTRAPELLKRAPKPEFIEPRS